MESFFDRWWGHITLAICGLAGGAVIYLMLLRPWALAMIDSWPSLR